MDNKPGDCQLQLQENDASQTRTRNMTSSPINSDVSALSDSDIATLSSSANSTLKSDLSSGNMKQGRTSHKEAIATLDNFLNDVSQTTEKVKLEEEQKLLKSAKFEPLRTAKLEPPRTANNKPLYSFQSQLSNEVFYKKWRSMPSVTSEDECFVFDSRLQKSVEEIHSIDYEVFTDDENITVEHEKKKAIQARKRSQKIDVSMSSQSSEVLNPPSYGITQLNHLCKFLEQYEQLQAQNSVLNKRVLNLQDTRSKRSSIATDVPMIRHSDVSHLPQRHSMVFAVPKEKPKKSKVLKKRNNNVTKYLASLPFVLAAKSVDNIKFGSSQNLDKIGKKTKTKKKYSVDDIEVGKTLHISGNWRNSSVKSPIKCLEKTFVDIPNENITGTQSDEGSKTREAKPEAFITPVIVETEKATPPKLNPDIKPPKSDFNKKVFPLKPPSPQKAKYEERNYKNIKKMTEWGTLQQAFPMPEIETSVDLLNHLETLVATNRPQHAKKNIHHGFKRKHGAKKHGESNMYLPQTEIQGFASTFLAAHAMANQVTLTLSLSDVEGLTTSVDENSQLPANNQAIPIS